MRKKIQAEESTYPDLPEVEPMAPDHIPDLLEEFCARHQCRPNLAIIEERDCVCFTLGEEDGAPIFVLEVDVRSAVFTSGIDFTYTEEGVDAMTRLFYELSQRIAYGQIEITNDGVQWRWQSPALRYPYFHGNVMHAIAYAEYLGDVAWPLVRQVATGDKTVEEVVRILSKGE